MVRKIRIKPGIKHVYRTNAALGYQQYAILLCIKHNEKKEKGDYLCINKEDIAWDDDTYVIGELVKNLDDFCVEKTSDKLKDSPLYNHYLFKIFMNEHKKHDRRKYIFEEGDINI